MASVGTPIGFGTIGAGYDKPPEALVVSRKIDVSARDYARDDEGLDLDGDPIAMAVMLALTQHVGKLSFDTAFGDRTNDLSKEVSDLKIKALRYAQEALSSLVKAGEIEVMGVDVVTEPGRFFRTVRWRRVRDGADRASRF